MAYYFSKILQGTSFEEAVERVTAGLKVQGFGVVTELNVHEVLKNKINVDFRKYKILGACNPHFAYKALKAEDKIGVFLPCSVVVQELENGDTEVAAVNPLESMKAVTNKDLTCVAGDVHDLLERVIDLL